MNISLKILGFIALVLIGFAFPLAFIFAIFSAADIYSEIKKDHDAPDSNVQQKGANSRLYTSKQSFRDELESPAEEAFFNAMEKHFDLKVKDGKLIGNEDIILDMQVKVLSYRLDFLVDKRLVVEIDGAAWHSSPEAIERDKNRDAALRNVGFHILRIPAKLVFNDPNAAINKVLNARKQVFDDNIHRAKERVRVAAAGGAPAGTPQQQLLQALHPKRMISAIGDVASSLEESTEKHKRYREQTEADIRRLKDPDTIAKIMHETDRHLVISLLNEFDVQALINLMNSKEPKELANRMIVEREKIIAEKKEAFDLKIRNKREDYDDEIPF